MKEGCEKYHHPDEPPGFIDWVDWARKMETTHTQELCPACHLWKVWVPKKSRHKPYRPATGTETADFQEVYCFRCKHDNYPDDSCEILMRALIHRPGEEQYPKEWIYREGRPTCTGFEVRYG